MMFHKSHPPQLNMSKETDALVMLARYPQEGKVKTRLASEIGVEQATNVYRQLLQENLLAAVQLPPTIDVYLRLAEEADMEKMRAMLQEMRLSQRVSCLPPSADNITDNLRDCFLELFDMGYHRIVSTAVDIPGRRTRSFLDYFNALGGNDLIVGPDRLSRGINVFGIKRSRVVTKRLVSKLFSGSTADLSPYEWTMKVIKQPRKLPLRAYIISKVLDVDTAKDLRVLQGRRRF